MNIIEKIGNEQQRRGMPAFRPGDTLRVYCRIREGDKERIQMFEGVCIRRKRGGVSSSFTVRKHSYGVGVERVFPLHSPLIERVEIANAGKVRRSRLYYLRELSGKAARIAGRRVRVQGRQEQAAVAEEQAIDETASSPQETAD